jgi:hypothetical protein
MNRSANSPTTSDSWFGNVSNENQTLLVWTEVLLSVGLASFLMNTILPQNKKLAEACQLVQCIGGSLFVAWLGWILLCRHAIPWRLLGYIPNNGSRRGGVRRRRSEIDRVRSGCRNQFRQVRWQDIRESVYSCFELLRRRWRSMRNAWSSENTNNSSCLELSTLQTRTQGILQNSLQACAPMRASKTNPESFLSSHS